MNPELPGAVLRHELTLQYQQACIFAGRPLSVNPYLSALTCGMPVRFVGPDGRRWVLTDTDTVREFTAADAGVPGSPL